MKRLPPAEPNRAEREAVGKRKKPPKKKPGQYKRRDMRAER
jgi:hypothetical protein